MNLNDIVAILTEKNNDLLKIISPEALPLFAKRISQFLGDDEEKQLFYLTYICFLEKNENEPIINFDNIWQWLGYNKKSNAKAAFLRHFKENKHFIFAAEVAAAKISGENRGGHNNETILLTLDTFKQFCMVAGTEKAEKVRIYFTKLERILIETIHEQLVEYQQNHQRLLSDNERILIANFTGKSVVYIILVEEFIIKFGWSNKINTRMVDHRRDFGRPLILKYIYETKNNINMEILIKSDERLMPFIFPKVYNGKNQTELIHLSQELTLEKLDLIFKDIMKKADETCLLKLENSQLKLEVANLKLENTTQKLQNATNPLEVKKLEIELDNRKLTIYSEIEKNTIKRNEAIYQIYNYESLELIKTYECIQDVLNETHLFKDAVPMSIRRNIETNTIYKGYRFWKIERTETTDFEDESLTEYDIPETVYSEHKPKYEQVIQISTSIEPQIINIFANSEEAAKHLLKTNLTNNIKALKKGITNTLSSKSNSTTAYLYKWRYYSQCDQNLLNEYLKTHTLPKVILNKGQISVYKFNQEGQRVLEYTSKTELYKLERTSCNTLKDAIDNKKLLNGYYFSLNDTFEIDIKSSEISSEDE